MSRYSESDPPKLGDRIVVFIPRINSRVIGRMVADAYQVPNLSWRLILDVEEIEGYEGVFEKYQTIGLFDISRVEKLA